MLNSFVKKKLDQDNNFDILDNDKLKEISKSFHKDSSEIFIKEEPFDKPVDPESVKLIENLKSNIVFDKVTPQENQEFIKNVVEDKNRLKLKYNDNIINLQTYTGEYGSNLGEINLYSVLKYLANQIDNNSFLIDKPINLDREKILIKKFIFVPVHQKEENTYDILIKNYTESPVMADTEILIKMNDFFYKFIKNELGYELLKVPEKKRKPTENIIKKFFLVLSKYTMNLLGLISHNLAKDDNKEKLRTNIVEYSGLIISRMNEYVLEQFNQYEKAENKLGKILQSSLEIKKTMYDKLTQLVELLKEQNLLMVTGKSDTSSYYDSESNNSKIYNLTSDSNDKEILKIIYDV